MENIYIGGINNFSKFIDKSTEEIPRAIFTLICYLILNIYHIFKLLYLFIRHLHLKFYLSYTSDECKWFNAIINDDINIVREYLEKDDFDIYCYSYYSMNGVKMCLTLKRYSLFNEIVKSDKFLLNIKDYYEYLKILSNNKDGDIKETLKTLNELFKYVNFESENSDEYNKHVLILSLINETNAFDESIRIITKGKISSCLFFRIALDNNTEYKLNCLYKKGYQLPFEDIYKDGVCRHLLSYSGIFVFKKNILNILEKFENFDDFLQANKVFMIKFSERSLCDDILNRI